MSSSQGRTGSDSGFALFLDFDGTLVEIAPTPDEVVVKPGLPRLLVTLRDRFGGALAIVTGRPVSGIDHHLPDLDLDACGMHGLERRVRGHVIFPDGLADLAPHIETLKARLAPYPGVIVEDKRIGVAVHWRTAPEAEGPARSAIDALAAELGATYKIQEGKAVREIVPAGASKGDGIRALLALEPYVGRQPIFIGDDKTDEYGFVAVNELGGVTIKVGPGNTAARHRLASPSMVHETLQDWATRLPDVDGLPPA
jgi:trehalose 6-phosphate phosphatase